MPIQGYQSGVLRGYLPGSGVPGVLSATSMRGPAIPPPIGSGRSMGVNPPMTVGGGYISGLRRKVASLDLINGMDQTLGKISVIPQGKRVRQNSRNLGNMSTASTVGPLAGRSLERIG